LTYPHRRYGSDQARYDWRPREPRPPLQWPGNAPVAAMLVIPLEFHGLNPATKPFKAPGAMVTPYPDLRHFTTRDYGNRVGVYRLLLALREAHVKATFAVNATLLSVLRPLIDAIASDGHEIAAHGFAADRIHWNGLGRAPEEALIAQTMTAFSAAGLAPTTWLSPARQQSFDTLDLIAAAGLKQCLDWESDSVPLAMRTQSGPIVALPLSGELEDRLLLIERRQTEAEWAMQIEDAAQLLRDEAPRFGGQVLGFSMTPYVSGLPFRMHAVRQIFAALSAARGVWSATAAQIAQASTPTEST
jgi:allantoinase